MKIYKRLFIPLVVLICISLTSCGGISSFTDLTDYFDEDVYVIQRYSSAQVDAFQEKRESEAEMLGKTLTGEIEYVIHVFDGTVVSDSEADWAYIVQYTTEDGAKEFESFCSKKCKRYGKFLIYGNSVVIDEIPEA